MRFSGTIILALWLFSGMGPISQLPAQESASDGLPWLESLTKGRQEALAKQRPILVRLGAAWCPNCRKLAEEIAKPAVQAELGRWVCVYLDVDRSPEEAAELMLTAVPALRIRTAGGQSIASHDGMLAAEELLDWLNEHYEIASAPPDAVLLDSGEPGVLAVVRLVRQFEAREPAVREAAIRRLLPYPQVSRAAAIKAFREGKLAARLAAWELLHQWQAPLDGLDPWQPESFTDERLAELEAWGTAAVEEHPSEPKDLSQQELVTAREQIDRMLRATPAEAEAIRERLARLRSTLLPEVYQQLKAAVTDDDRERLLALRYRLVSSDALVLAWPGGLTRLADSDSRQRVEATEELAKRATAADQQLLLELFSDPDPLVREISLRGLQHIGDKDSTAALVKLLDDPEPNVRAAVLNQLAESPSKEMVPKVAEYLKKETDADLIVHAIRFLKAARGPKAIKCLMSLLDHESWQVRAEAAEAIGGASQGISYISVHGVDPFDRVERESTQLMADAYVALIELLDDSDAFVVSRALEGLSNVDMVVAVEPLVEAAKKHPNLATNIVSLLAGGRQMRTKALPYLRVFARHEDPAIRAAAIKGLCRGESETIDEELVVSLQDTDAEVRIAAAFALFTRLENQRETTASAIQQGRRIVPGSLDTPDDPDDPFASSTTVTFPQVQTVNPLKVITSAAVRLLFGKSEDQGTTADEAAPEPVVVPPTEMEFDVALEPQEPLVDELDASDVAEETEADDSPTEHPWDRWLAAYYEGKERPEWATLAVEPLQKMLQAESAEEVSAAAQALVPLGKVRLALPKLVDSASSNPELFRNATQVLPWLVWEDRLGLFEQLRTLDLSKETFGVLVSAMTEIPDRRTAEPFWRLLAEEELTPTTAGALQQGLRAAYLGNRYYSSSNVSPSDLRDLTAAARSRTTSGSELQRLTALTLLAGVAKEDAAEVSQQFVDDTQLSDPMRRDAFKVLLLSQTGPRAATRAATTALGGDDASTRKLALAFLVGDRSGFHYLRDSLYLQLDYSDLFSSSRSSGQPIIPEPPLGLELDDVQPWIDDSDPQVAAYAGYLAALFEEADGLRPLLRYWHDKEQDEALDKLVYRAIALLDDSTHLGELRTIYGKLDQHSMPEFYWTIRIMSGPEILRFRKEIRDQVGAERLR